MIRRKGVQSHDQTESVTEVLITQKGLQRSWLDGKGYRVMIREKGLQSHGQTERGTKS